MQAINNKNINRIDIVIPNDEVLIGFSKIVKPVFDYLAKLRNENQTLAETRDTLLPKLISGELDVSNINID